MTFTFTAEVAWDPNGRQNVKNVSFQVFAVADTGFTTPLPITDTFGVPLPGNILNSGNQGTFPSFQQATNPVVVLADSTRTYAWTLNCVPSDAAIAAFISTGGSATQTALSTTYASTSALTAHTGNTSNPHAVTKAQVGLGNVDNTADTAKPVSTAQATAIGAKLDSATAATTYAPISTTIPKWVTATAYTAGQQVVSPSGDIVQAIANHTSGASYTPANWAYVRFADYFFNVKAYGAKGDGIADDTAAFTSAISAGTSALTASTANMGEALVIVPNGFFRLTNLSVPAGIKILCNGSMLGPVAGVAGALITFTGGHAGIDNAYFAGGAVTGASGITVASTGFHVTITNCKFDNWDGRAIYDLGIATRITACFAQNCLLGANSLSAYTGVVELANTDAWMMDCEITASRRPSRGFSTGKFACALAVTGANNMVTNVVAETSDHGVYVGSGATQSSFVNVRGELNYGHGWVVDGGNGRVVNCMALRNSQASNLGYNGWNVTGANATAFVVTNFVSDCTSQANKQNYGIFDGQTSTSNYNRYLNPMSIADNVPFFSTGSTLTSFGFAENPPINLGASNANPYVAGLKNFIANNTSAYTVTGFSNGVNGQSITIKGDGFTTLANGANIVTLSGSNLLLAAGTWYRFLRIASVWNQIA